MRFVVLLLLIVGSYLLICRLYAKYWNRGLSVRLAFSKENVQEGEALYLEEVIENRNRLPLPTLKVKFQVSRNLRFADEEDHGRAGGHRQYSVTDQYYRGDMFTVLPFRKITRRLSLIPVKRGCYTIQSLQLVCSDLFLRSVYAEHYAEEHRLLVSPRKYSVHEAHLPFPQLMGELVTKVNGYEEPCTFRGIREYLPTDPLRTVNWKVSAKWDDWYVNQYEPAIQREVLLVVDGTKHSMRDSEDVQEELLRVTDSVAQEFLRLGMRVALRGNMGSLGSEKGIHIVAGSGLNQSLAIDEALALVDWEEGPQPYEEYFREFTKEPGYVVYISCSGHEPLRRAVDERLGIGLGTSWILVRDAEEEEAELSSEVRKMCTLWRRR